ncbi:Histone H3 (Lys9) methyltransferase SUV39H1/Clr4, required for transcriptional silencing [Plasmopara halstedii]|uniref:Histone H3 (Lys9) methyltransferase SUV39H1/Clr4, required for transcriptional silencing n=1 Tax=Plasmopara halstedii TaxID=4781 RepID=A0A0P1AMI2_PLAHL|nr:Histone H3 (Lys9) methyltransferase SUV39H1/Clr4, required for transcriptional silencing [Plasmopara halstedii]CEG42256.1 Histone H3 (Lys9) methyltransferase SUV39H1/Clr4, required for transcriptional silencing [Plasmopara halstedii]|eukprot:XP_024578625.1 Histone H3 (Lys9) methyltransferase SUV39H1/Clr4, required for transcriptional silencing [Plasmopara halstedii]
MRRKSSFKQERGAHLQLAQRHRKIVAGCFQGPTTFEPEFATPGVVGNISLSFTTSGPLGQYSRVTCQLPNHGWSLSTIPPPNVVIRLPSSDENEAPETMPRVQMTWNSTARIMEFTLLNESVIPAGTPIKLVVSGVGTPEKATPQSEAIVTTFEKVVTRKTVPPSTRGGQIIDGPSIFTIPKIVPGAISGARRWSPLNCCPGVVTDVELAFIVSGKVPPGGKLLVELPPHGWDMDEHPKVWLRTFMYPEKYLAAMWNCKQHTLEIIVDGDDTSIASKTNVVLTITNVTNPKNETILLIGDQLITAARLTTLSASGGVIDGPARIEVARITELRERDYILLTQVLDAGGADDLSVDGEGIAIDKVPELLRRAGLLLSDNLYETLVVPCFPVHTGLSLAADKEDKMPSISPLIKRLSREEVLNVFALVYAPAYKYGQKLRLACGRGQLEIVNELVSRGCNPNASDASGWSALHYTTDFGQLDVLNFLVEIASVQSESNEIRPVLLDLNARDGHGWTPLMCAAANGHIDIIQRLLQLGANILLSSSEGRSALHWAASRGMSAAVAVLMDAGADVNQVDHSGWTPLHCATIHGNTDCAAFLIDKGADITIRDKLNHVAHFYSNL